MLSRWETQYQSTVALSHFSLHLQPTVRLCLVRCYWHQREQEPFTWTEQKALKSCCFKMTYFDVIYLLSVFEFSESCQWLQSWSLHFFPNRDLRLPLIVYFHRWSFKKNIKHFKTPNKISRTVNILCYWLPCSPCLFLLWKTNSLMSDKRARTHDFHPKSECRNTFCSSSLSHLTIFNNSSILEHSESKKLTVNSNVFFFFR